MSDKPKQIIDANILGNKGELASMVNYQQGSIVSKILLQKPVGSMTIFAFGERQELSEHISPYDAILSVYDGEADVVIDGVSHRLASGDIIIMPANIPHAVKAVTKFKMMLVMIKEPPATAKPVS